MTDVLNKVTTGEADAGLVYVTDVKAAGDEVKGITFPESSSAVNTYPIAALADAKNKDLAQEFVGLVTGDRRPAGPGRRRVRQAVAVARRPRPGRAANVGLRARRGGSAVRRAPARGDARPRRVGATSSA